MLLIPTKPEIFPIFENSYHQEYLMNSNNEDNERLTRTTSIISFNQLQEDLFGNVTQVSGIDIANLDTDTLCNLPLYGSFTMNSYSYSYLF